ncbi:MAG TPA: nuclear transport factor 2 family protein [Candidatus Polarisedimenticolia bacterium]|nr:nuclear transport factor 2 family protein [Candidatus Polarisedimenticolia bacterium]
MVARLCSSVPSRASRLPSIAPVACLLVALFALTLTACGSAQADSEAIRALVTREVTAINKKDLRTLSEIWSSDKKILMFDVPPPGRFQGWDQIGSLWKDFFDRVNEIHLTVDAVQAEAQGTLGYATYDWAMTGRLGTYPLEDRGQATAIYHKEGKSWKLIHAHYSPVPPALVGQDAAAAGAASTGGSPSSPGGPGAPGASPRPGGPTPAAHASPRPSGSPAAAPRGGTPAPAGAGSPAPSASPPGAPAPTPGAPGRSG